MTLGERIRAVRTSADVKMSMAKFAEVLGVTSGAVSQWENNQKMPSNAVIVLISKQFRINETWLRTGEGEMWSPMTREQEIARITASIIREDNPIRIQLERIVCNLTDEQLLHIYEIAKELVDAVDEKNLPE